MSDITHQTSDLGHWTSGLTRLTLDIRSLTSYIWNETLDIIRLTSEIRLRTSDICFSDVPKCDIRCPMSEVWCPMYMYTLDIERLTSYIIACEQAPYLGKRIEPRENPWARGRGKASLQRSLINCHFHPGNPGTPQSVKTVTANVLPIRKVTTACQV